MLYAWFILQTIQSACLESRNIGCLTLDLWEQMYLSLSDSLLKLTQVPVVIVRNKVDLCAEELSTPSVSWESELALIMHRFKVSSSS